MRKKQSIQCPYCDKKATPPHGALGKPINPADTGTLAGPGKAASWMSSATWTHPNACVS